jgi:hypothetical protein
MKKLMLLGAIILGWTVSGWAGFPVSGSGGGDNIQPIGPGSDQGPADLQPGPGIPAAVVPEPSTISLLLGAGAISSWFVLRRKR